MLLARLGVDANAQLLSDAYIAHLAEADFLVDGALELLQQLRGTVPLVMLTNGLSSVQRSRFSRRDMNRYFDGIVISEEVGVQKPDPDVFRIALSHAPGVSVDRAIMFGDNLNSDIRGAMAVGMDACWVNLRGRELTDGPAPTFTVTALGQIPSLLGL